MVGGLDLALRFCADISCFLDKISYNALCDKNPNITKSQQLKIRAGEELADIVKPNHWFFPSIGEMSRLSFYWQHGVDRKSTRLNSSHITRSRMPSSA